ncbi:patatin-like phospholipase family protein [bacterium]|nr:patatin-like phospholipase family protein [bacterium]
MSSNLVFLAGKNAYSLVKNDGLKPEMVKVIAGAAGGPKWLVLDRLDRLLFSEWFNERTEPLYLVGSSIGAWRFTAMCQNNPIDAQHRFELSYINQRYTKKPSSEEVSAESRKIIESYLDDKGIDEILNHPFLRINFLSARCKGLTASNNKWLLGLGLSSAVVLNLINRNLLGMQFERTLFYHPQGDPPFLKTSDFPINRIALNRANYKQALLSSGSIPFVMDGVQQIDGVPDGTYRDGGLTDYHLDIPYHLNDNNIVLYPHFSNRIIPGWLDKSLKWRKPTADFLKNVLLVAPSESYIRSLPNQKIPDRNDFLLYKGRDEERIKDWNTVVEKGERLADEFAVSVMSGAIKKLVKPLF